MNQLLLLGGLVLAIYIMNENKMFKSLSLGKDNTLLIVVFCGVILFMCMRKKVEGMVASDDLQGGDCQTIGMVQHTLQVVNEDGEPAFNPISICVTPHQEAILTRNLAVADLSTANIDVVDNSDPTKAQGLGNVTDEKPAENPANTTGEEDDVGGSGTNQDNTQNTMADDQNASNQTTQ